MLSYMLFLPFSIPTVMKHRILSVISFLFFALFVSAQEHVSGILLDSKGKPAKRIKMQLKGRLKIQASSAKGTFELKDVKEGDTLFVYPTRKLMAAIPLASAPAYTIHLGDNSLRYVCNGKTIVCMYQPVLPSSYNSNIITYEQIQQTEVGNLVELLRGKVAGLQINYADGKPKASIRGASSFALNTEPLFLVGGTEYNSLEEANDAVAIEDIREIEVKKDGSEYGMKGANGVIIIKMK